MNLQSPNLFFFYPHEGKKTFFHNNLFPFSEIHENNISFSTRAEKDVSGFSTGEQIIITLEE